MSGARLTKGVNKASVAISCGIAVMFSTANAIVIESRDGIFPVSNAFSVTTLRDRPLDEYAKIAPSTAFDVRHRSDFDDNYADTIADGLFFAPGIIVNTLDLKEPRIHSRGFGLSNIHQRSGVTVLRDGAPLTDVHGTTNSADIDLLSAERIEILRSGSTLRAGVDNFGGVINVVSRRGSELPSGITARFDAGSSIGVNPGGQAHIGIAGGQDSSTFDYYAGVTGAYELGLRDNNRRTSEQFHGNLGLKVTNSIDTRFFLSVVNSTTDIAGGLELADLLDDPENATPSIQLGPLFPGGPTFTLVDGAGADDVSRDLREARIANETKLSLLAHDFILRGHYTRREIDSPQVDFFGYLEEDGSEWGANLELSRDIKFFGRDARYRVGGGYVKGSKVSRRSENDFGQPGILLTETEPFSDELTGFVEGIYHPLNFLTVDLGAKFTRVNRARLGSDGARNNLFSYTGVSGRLGASAAVTKNLQIFASASRAYQPTPIDVLLANDPTNFSFSVEPRAFTVEAGLRGALGDWLAWDITAYDMSVENDFINIADSASLAATRIIINIDETSRKGVEAAVDLALFPSLFERQNAALTLRNVYNYSDFRFVDSGSAIGGINGDRLAGIPVHNYRGELRYDAKDAWFAAVNVQMNAGDYFADHVNAVSVPTDTIIGVSAGMKLNDNVEIFASGENLTNRAYVAGVTPILSQVDDQARIFSPGPPLTVYGGLRVRFR